MNNKGQFSIIAALLVALVLVGAVVSTYSAVRFSDIQEQPQILSVSDETNLAVKEMLGFTVGYYGSVLKVTGNQTYAKELASDYLSSGLINMDAVNPEWGLTINVTDLELAADWFTNQSYSQGNATVTYDLKGLGMTGVSYSASIRLDVQILEAESSDQARLNILTDDGKPLINLGTSNFNFHQYDYETSTWGLVQPDSVVSYADGTYLIDLPEGLLTSSFDVEVKDNRGLMVIASSYSQYVSTLTWNTSNTPQSTYYVDTNSTDVDSSANKGTLSNFAAQQNLEGLVDTFTEDIYDVDDNVTFVNSVDTSGNNPTSGSFTLPSDWVAGDVAVFWWYTRDSGKTFTYTEGDITIKYNTASSGYGRIVIGYRTLQDGDSSFNWDASYVYGSTTIWGVSVFRNVYNLGDPFEAVSGNPATFSTNDPNPPAASVSTVGSAVLTIYGKNNDYTSISPPTDYTLCGSASSTWGSDASATAAYILDRPAGSENASAWDLGGGGSGDDGYVWTGVLKAVEYTYCLDIEEQWLNVNTTIARQDLCIKTGDFSDSELLLVDVWHDGSWHYLTSLVPNHFNNASITQYTDSATLTIRFRGGDDLADSVQSNWDIDAVFIKPQRDVDFLLGLQETTFVVEVLQNGTMRWLGQNLEMTTDTLPIPPVPVKAIHVNQTFVNGTNSEVPFQVEDWASKYQIPLGLTSNTTVFSNRQMIVFLLDYTVTNFTIWWDGSDSAVQTPLAYTNIYFTDDEDERTLNNGQLMLEFSEEWFNLTSTVGSVSSKSTLMRINNNDDDSGSNDLSFPISNGIVRDIMLGEAEYSGGITSPDCPNTYTNIVITLPAGVTYYTYQLRVMFIDSARARTVSDLCPIRLTTSVTSAEVQTENGTLADFPIVQNGTGVFSDYASGGHTAHHWSQFITDTGEGTGIMFTNAANENLYAFDTIAGSSTGALDVNADSSLIEVLPVSSLASASFMYAYDVSWHGAVATFDGTTPVCSLYDGTTPAGLWLLVEYPPQLTVTAALQDSQDLYYVIVTDKILLAQTAKLSQCRAETRRHKKSKLYKLS